MDFKRLQEAKNEIKTCKRFVFLGGAGVSTASGISDFRSPQGLYNVRSKYGVPYETMLSHDYFEENPETFYDFYWSTMVNSKAKPNKAHFALAEFSKSLNLVTVTQNIDGLDIESGQKIVLEVHGSVKRYFCPICERKFSLDELTPSGVPHCKNCGAILKPDVILYGEPLDEDTLLNAIASVKMADCLIIGGTSMNVYPIASLPNYFNGKLMIMINKEATTYDKYCKYVFHEDIGETLDYLLGGK